MGKLSISSKIPTIPLNFWDDLIKAQKNEWPSIVKKYELNIEQLNYVAANREAVFDRMRASEESQRSWNESVSRCYAKYGMKV